MRQILNLPDDVIKYIHTQDNMSRYIARLVRKDMHKDNLEEKVKQIISQMVQSGCIAQAGEGHTTAPGAAPVFSSITSILNL